MVEGLIYELPRWLTNTIAALGGVVFLYLIFEITNFFLNRERRRILFSIKKDLKRIEEKVDTLKGTSEGKKSKLKK